MADKALADRDGIRCVGPLIHNRQVVAELEVSVERANVEFVTVLDRGRIRMRVWERGAGITQACGSGACAAAIAAARRGLCERKVEVILDGGSLFIDWRADNHVVMSGPVAVAFTGELDDFVGAA